MASLSKFFEDTVQNCACNEIVHSGSCTKNILLNIHKFFLSNIKYFAPLVGLPLIVHIRTLNKEVLKSAFKYYLGSVWCGTTTGLCVAGFICLFRNMFGSFKRYFFVFAPSLIGGFALMATPNIRVQRLFETSIFQCTIESFLMKRQNLLTKSVADSVLLQALIFMGCSGLILHAKRHQLHNGFWLLAPTLANTTTKNTTAETNASSETSDGKKNSDISLRPSNFCSHQGKGCASHILMGVRNYLAIGLTLDIIKMLMSSVHSQSQGFSSKLLAKLHSFKIGSCAFLASYMAIYRMAHCWLNRRSGVDSPGNHAVAAVLGGSCYIFYPKLTLLSFALVLSMQILCQRFKTSKRSASSSSDAVKDHNSAALERFKKLPFNKLLYPLALGYLVHTYCFQRLYVSSLAETIIEGVTGNYARRIRQGIEKLENRMGAGLTI